MKRAPPAVALALAAAVAVPALAYDVEGMRDAMRSVFASMRVLLELSASEARLADPANSNAILAATGELADQASMVSEHAPRDETSFLATSLDRYALWIRRAYEWRRYDTMEKLVHDAVDVCIACHTRLPSRRDSPLARDFLDERAISALPPWQRAKLQIATRRFGDAMTTLEGLLAGDLDARAFEETARAYLVVAERVKGDPARARRTLQAIAGRPGLAAERRARLWDWVGELQRLEVSPPATGDLAAARELVVAAEKRRDAGLGDPLVDYVAASRTLYEYVEDETGSVAEGADAYYLLGLCQYRIEADAWLPQAELFLEKAIRTAPASDSARRALALLTQKVTESFAAQGGGVPEEVSRHLEMLRELVESGR